jgi:hypothetical protein
MDLKLCLTEMTTKDYLVLVDIPADTAARIITVSRRRASKSLFAKQTEHHLTAFRGEAHDMAHKPGQWDLRCPEAVQSAFLLHSRYGRMPQAHEAGQTMVARGNWGFAQYLPSRVARKALESALPEIVRRQQRNGMWFRKNAEARSYPILKALKRAELLPELLEKGGLRHGPYQRFREADDEWGYLVRRGIMESCLPGDGVLHERLVSAYAVERKADGSWAGSVARTALVMERLLELGLPPDDPVLRAGSRWLLSQFRETLERKRPGRSWGITIRDMFTTGDCQHEWRAAAEFLSHHGLTASCFVSIPLVQTGLALRVLVRLGHEGDERVAKAFASLLDMQTRPGGFAADLGDLPLGHWCANKCRFKLEARENARRRGRAADGA